MDKFWDQLPYGKICMHALLIAKGVEEKMKPWEEKAYVEKKKKSEKLAQLGGREAKFEWMGESTSQVIKFQSFILGGYTIICVINNS